MAIKKICIGCRAPYDFVAGTVYVCKYCLTEQNPGLTEDATGLLKSATALRRNKQYHEAKEEYKRVLKEVPELGEAYWGLFLCDYEVSEEEAEIRAVASSKRCVCENLHYQKAIEYSGRSRAGWEGIADKIELCRKSTVQLSDAIRKNAYRIALICDPSCLHDRALADDIYQSLKSRIDVYYPPESLKRLSVELHDQATAVALKEVALLFLVCSQESSGSRYLEEVSARFFESHYAHSVYAIAEDSSDIPLSVECSDVLIPYASADLSEMLDQIRIMGEMSLDEKSKFRKTGRCVKNESLPSPLIILN